MTESILVPANIADDLNTASPPANSDDVNSADLSVFVISLPQSPRRSIITERLRAQNIQFTFIDAIAGASLSAAKIAEITDPARTRRRMGRLLTRNEVGCALSHRKAYDTLLSSGAQAAVILEDDAIPSAALRELVENWRDLPQRIGLLSLFKGSGIIKRQGAFKFGEARLAQAASTIEYACGYFIRRDTARILFDATQKISSVADWPVELRALQHYVTEPDFVRHDFSLPSEIGEDRPGFTEPPPSLRRKFLGLKAILFITYFQNRQAYDSLYNYFERELRVRLLARMPWRYEILPGYYRWPDKPLVENSGMTPDAG